MIFSFLSVSTSSSSSLSSAFALNKANSNGFFSTGFDLLFLFFVDTVDAVRSQSIISVESTIQSTVCHLSASWISLVARFKRRSLKLLLERLYWNWNYCVRLTVRLKHLSGLGDQLLSLAFLRPLSKRKKPTERP